MLRWRSRLGIATALWIAGCNPYGRSGAPAAPADLPPRFEPAPFAAGVGEPSRVSSRPQPRFEGGRFWAGFGDPELSTLIEQALAQNLGLRAAYARIEQAHALAVQAAAQRYPQVDLQGQANYSRSVNAFVGTAAQTTTLRGSLPVSYEVDWFGRYAGQEAAADLDTEAARADSEAAAMTLAAQVAEAYFDLVDARARRLVLIEQLRINETFLELTRLRFQQGLASALDTHQQRQQVAATRAQLDLVQTSERVAQHQLAVLVGDTPGQGRAYLTDRARFPELPARPEPGVPADLLRHRPDVRAAARRVEAADERVATALASRLPSLVISGAPGYNWTEFDSGNDLFGGVNHGSELNAGATLSLPIFDGFLRSGQIDQNRARVRELVASYQSTVQQAVREVESALSQELGQREHILDLRAQLEAARDALESARDRYRTGLSDFLPVLTALQGVQQTELALLTAERQLLSFRVQLERALGGAWTRDLELEENR